MRLQDPRPKIGDVGRPALLEQSEASVFPKRKS